MTANQVKRIRSRLEKAAALLKEADALYQEFNPYYHLGDQELRQVVIDASRAGGRVLADLEQYDSRNRQRAEQAAWELTIVPGAKVAEREPYESGRQIVGRVVRVSPEGTLAIIEPERGSDQPMVGRNTSRLFRIPDDA